jgi:hypothetical protein
VSGARGTVDEFLDPAILSQVIYIIEVKCSLKIVPTVHHARSIFDSLLHAPSRGTARNSGFQHTI